MNDNLLVMLIVVSNSAMLLYIVMLSAENARLKRDLLERSRWHAREIARWRERL